MRSLAEKYFRGFTKPRRDLPLCTAGCSGELQGWDLLRLPVRGGEMLHIQLLPCLLQLHNFQTQILAVEESYTRTV